MADRAHTQTDERLLTMEAHLTEIYSRAQKDLSKTAKDFFKQFDRLDTQKRKQVEKGTLTEQEYKTWRKNKILYSRRFAVLKQHYVEQLSRVNETATAYINGELPEVYAINYNAIAPTVDGVGGYSFTLVDADTVRKLAMDDETLLPYKHVDGRLDIRWNTTKVNAEVLQGILQGLPIDKIAHNLQNVTEKNRQSAIRNARTTVTSAENKGRMDSYKRAQDDGIRLQKEWLATADGRTRHAHATLDGQVKDIDEPFETVLWLSKTKRKPDKIMYPGDPSADPANVYNCRCTIVAQLGQGRGDSRVVRDENGKSVRTEDMTYGEWTAWRAQRVHSS